MIAEDQSEVIEFLASPGTYGETKVERVDTHTASVFLAGARAFKLKRAVRFDYVDFSTRDRRRFYCDAEVRLSERTAPGLYRGVTAVTRDSNGNLALGGTGQPIEWLVEMNPFPQEALFDRLAAEGGLDLRLTRSLAAAIARFHLSAERRPEHGGAASMEWVVRGNNEGFLEFGGACLDASRCTRVTLESSRQLERCRSLLEARRAGGFVRQCHGDLHLRNIVLLDQQPALFDGVEFNDRIACIDVLYDLAFLLMDLWHRQLPRHANVVWNEYLVNTDDLDGIPLMPLFLSCRAAVRAKTSATAAAVQDTRARRLELEEEARAYLALAESLVHPRAAALIAVGGLSGSGKSTLAASLAPLAGAVPGALVVRSDEIRKILVGVPRLEPLGPGGYTPEMSARVYHTLAERAQAALAGRHAVVADAVFARLSDRAAIERVAVEAGVPFVGLWLDAAQPVLLSRVAERHADASDATPAVVRTQQVEGGIAGWHRLDASLAADDVCRLAVNQLSEALPRTWITSRLDET